ncbi:MAG TPA: hypothetical protein VGQ64_09540, partial [Candidatus Limnocylindrales bacterium]|nr:hypothetical protein [Candidatus Limnocylindrales bacterium]
MRDMFDEFLDELRRRQGQAASGRSPGGADDSPDPEEDAVDDDPIDGARAEDEPADDEPEPIRRPASRQPRGGAGRPPRGPGSRRPARGGRRDGGTSIRRQLLTALGVVLAIFVVIMLVVGLELWTDAIWYTSVGYDAVFWT